MASLPLAAARGALRVTADRTAPLARARACAGSTPSACASVVASRRAGVGAPRSAVARFALSRVEHLGTRLAARARVRAAACTQSRGGVLVRASFFGVGAPEAFVIAIVSLLVFGPKGLAEIAKNLGQTLRAFQPTIRELQQVSQDFKSALDQEIGLDDLKSSAVGTPRPDLDSKLTEEMRRASEAAAWGTAPPLASGASALEGDAAPAQAAPQPPAAAPAAPPAASSKLPDLSQLSD